MFKSKLLETRKDGWKNWVSLNLFWEANGDELRIYLSGFSVRVVCGSVNGQKVKLVKSSYPFLKNLKLADEGLHKENIDWLIRAYFSWDIVDGLVKTGNGVAPITLGSKLGWLLSGHLTKHNPSSLTTHAENIVLHIKTGNSEERKIDNFWKLDLLEIQEKKLVKLPFKENIPFVSDDYDVSFKK